jgi:hypothetical protein
MSWPAPGQEPVVESLILGNKGTAKSAAGCLAGENKAKVAARVWMWCTEGSRSEDGRVGAAAVLQHGNQWRTSHNDFSTEFMHILHAELLVIGFTLRETVKRRDRLEEYGVKPVAVFNN